MKIFRIFNGKKKGYAIQAVMISSMIFFALWTPLAGLYTEAGKLGAMALLGRFIGLTFFDFLLKVAGFYIQIML